MSEHLTALAVPVTVVKCLEDILAERARQDEKWGRLEDEEEVWRRLQLWRTALSQAIAVIREPGDEGELSQALLSMGAVCVAWMAAIKRRTE